MITRFIRDEKGATAIEYALIAVLISIAIFAAVIPIGGTLSDVFGQAKDGLAGAQA